jgi:hypothetical protein
LSAYLELKRKYETKSPVILTNDLAERILSELESTGHDQIFKDQAHHRTPTCDEHLRAEQEAKVCPYCVLRATQTALSEISTSFGFLAFIKETIETHGFDE